MLVDGEAYVARHMNELANDVAPYMYIYVYRLIELHWAILYTNWKLIETVLHTANELPGVF